MLINNLSSTRYKSSIEHRLNFLFESHVIGAKIQRSHLFLSKRKIRIEIVPSSVKVLGKGVDTLSARQRKRREEIPNEAKYAKSKKLQF